MQTAVGVFGGEHFVDGVDVPPLMVENAGNSGRSAISSLNCPSIIAVEHCREHLVPLFTFFCYLYKLRLPELDVVIYAGPCCLGFIISMKKAVKEITLYHCGLLPFWARMFKHVSIILLLCHHM